MTREDLIDKMGESVTAGRLELKLSMSIATFIRDLELSTIELQEQLDRLKDCSNCEIAPGKKCHECIHNCNPDIQSTMQFDHWREHLSESS